MSGPQGTPGPQATPGEVKATQKVAAAQQAVKRSFAGSLLKLAALGGAGYLLYHLYAKSDEPLPQPMTDAVSKAVSVTGGAMQQQMEEVRGSYPGGASVVPGKGQEAAKPSKG